MKLSRHELQNIGRNAFFIDRGRLRLMDKNGQSMDFTAWVESTVKGRDFFPPKWVNIAAGSYEVLDKVQHEALIEAMVFMYRTAFQAQEKQEASNED